MTAPSPATNSAFCTQEITVETHCDFVHFAHMKFDDRPEPAKRLEQARLARGFSDARQAADAFGWNYHTYAQHENGTRGIVRAAARYAKAYGVSEAWLLTGTGAGPRLATIRTIPDTGWRDNLRKVADDLKASHGLRLLSADEQAVLADLVQVLLLDVKPELINAIKLIAEALSQAKANKIERT